MVQTSKRRENNPFPKKNIYNNTGERLGHIIERRRVKRESEGESDSMRTMAELQKSSEASSLSSVSLLLLLFLWANLTSRPSMAANEQNKREIPVGVILDLNSTLGSMLSNSLTLAVEDYYDENKDTATKIVLRVRNVSENNFTGAAAEAYKLMNDEKVHAILGPQNSEQARYIVRLGDGEFQKPVIWFPMTGPSLLPPPSPSSIYTGQDLNCYQFQAIAAIIKALGWQSIVPIYEETEYGSHLVPCLTNVLKEMGIRMANVTAIASKLEGINTTLDTLNNMRTHVFLVHMSMDFGKEFIRSAQQKEMMVEGYAWILTQELSSLTNPQVGVIRYLYKGSTVPVGNFTDFFPLKGFMQGALGVRPMDLKRPNERRQIERDYNDKFKSGLTIYGWWAYHTIEALAMALEKPGSIDNGQKLRDEITATNFTAKSGVQFDLTKGQLDQSEYEVYNVIAARERIVGSWSPKNGLVRNYSEGGGGGEASAGREYQLKDPLWPGDTLDKPPKLRIGVPGTNSFPEFVNVYNYSGRQVNGFAYNVFLRALGVLPFPLNNYEFVPLPNKSRSNNTTYDDMLCTQMKDEDLDAIIGDITILASRTNCVDFTLPYLDSSVAMLVRVKNASTSTGILFKPFEWSLWLTLGGIFVAATIIIIILEKYKTKINGRNEIDEFLLNPFLVYKIDVMEKFESSAAGWMVILTSFLFLLVVQVYTANLASILTQGKDKEPSFKDETEIIKKNLSVGYRQGSWVRELLTEQLGFNPSRLIALTSREEYKSSLSHGTKKGGVDAIFDETPYLTLFLSQYKSHFAMTGHINKTGGFAFAFPRKSSLGPHFSNAILKVTKDAEPYRVLMARSSLPTFIEDLDFEDESDIETSILSISNFGGLYPILLAVMALFLCLAIPSMIRRLPSESTVTEWWSKKQPFKLANKA